MNIRNIFQYCFPKGLKSITKGLTYGIIVSFGFWLPLPDSFQLSKSWLPFLFAVLLILLFVGIAYGQKHADEGPNLGWKAMGFLLSGFIFPLIPLEDHIKTHIPPTVFVIIGILILISGIVRGIVDSK